jgi:hypothetical protein
VTKTQIRAVNGMLRAVRRERRDSLSGKAVSDWWGVPWCTGPGSPYHQEPCEGCGTVAWCRDRADEVGEQIRQLEASLAPVVQGALFYLFDDAGAA